MGTIIFGLIFVISPLQICVFFLLLSLIRFDLLLLLLDVRDGISLWMIETGRSVEEAEEEGEDEQGEKCL